MPIRSLAMDFILNSMEKDQQFGHLYQITTEVKEPHALQIN